MTRNLFGKVLFAAVVLAGGVASAQTQVYAPSSANSNGITSHDFTVSAAINTEIYFTVNDDTIDCGTLTNTTSATLSTACSTTGLSAAGADASVTVTANADWAISVDDNGGFGPDAVTLSNAGAPGGAGANNFVVAINGATTGGSTGATPVTFTTGAISSLEVTDYQGAYTGSFAVTIAAAP